MSYLRGDERTGHSGVFDREELEQVLGNGETRKWPCEIDRLCGWFQCVDATLARSLSAGVSKAKLVSEQ